MRAFLNQLQEHASKQSEVVALESAGDLVSYGALWQSTECLKNWLLSLDIHCLAFQLDNGLDWVLLDIAALKAGITLIPVPVFFSEQQLEHLLEDAAVDLFISAEYSPLVAAWPEAACPLSAELHSFKRLGLNKTSPKNCKITYTSGSTGAAKAVCLPYEQLDKVVAGVLDVMSEISISHHLCVLPLATLLENVAGLYAPLMKGIKISVPSLSRVGLVANQLDVACFVAVLNDLKPDSLILVPQLLTAVTTLNALGLLEAPEFEFIAVGGGRISQGLLDTAADQGLPVYQGYGLSEVGSVAALNLPGTNRPGSVGKPLPHVQVRISATAEIEIKADKKWLATGDLGHFDSDGYLYISGRIKNMFITSYGRNVNPEWVEAALTQQPAIAQALIVGESQAHNLALIWTRFPQTATELEGLVNKANQALPGYARVHAFVLMPGHVPEKIMTDNGRLKREIAMAFCQDKIDRHYAIADRPLSASNCA